MTTFLKNSDYSDGFKCFVLLRKILCCVEAQIHTWRKKKQELIQKISPLCTNMEPGKVQRPTFLEPLNESRSYFSFPNDI